MDKNCMLAIAISLSHSVKITTHYSVKGTRKIDNQHAIVMDYHLVEMHSHAICMN